VTDALVGILVGSASDLPVLQQATAILERLGIPHEIHVMSAHRTPDLVDEYARTAEERGLVAVICGAGRAASSVLRLDPLVLWGLQEAQILGVLYALIAFPLLVRLSRRSAAVR